MIKALIHDHTRLRKNAFETSIRRGVEGTVCENNICEVFARLMERLAENDTLSSDDLTYIVQPVSVEFVDEEEETEDN